MSAGSQVSFGDFAVSVGAQTGVLKTADRARHDSAPMHPEQIKAAIRMRGTTPSAIADELGLNRATVSNIIHGRDASANVARAISRVTGIAIDSLWPGKYPVTARSDAKSVARSLLRSHA